MKISPLLRPMLYSLVCGFLLPLRAHAGSATYTGDSSNWFSSQNWDPATVPEYPGDVATFDTAENTYLYLSQSFVSPEIDSIVFTAQADAFSFNFYDEPSFTFSGAGIVNNSSSMQVFTVAAVGEHESGYPDVLYFNGNATAGDLTQFTTEQGGIGGFAGILEFNDASSAGSATIINQGTSDAYDGFTEFTDTSTAANSTIINTAGQFKGGGGCDFYDSSSAGSATIINNAGTGEEAGGGEVSFNESATAGTSTITCNGNPESNSYSPASVTFNGDSVGDEAHVILFGDGRLSVGSHNPPGVTIGSLAGDGNVMLTTTSYNPPLITLQIGSDNLDTTFSGVIQDMIGRPGGSLAKIGRGTLTLTGANTYAGATTVREGELQINNTTGSGTGTGRVEARAGTLRGSGTIAGPVQIGEAKGRQAILVPGSVKRISAPLTIESTLSFLSDGLLRIRLNSHTGGAGGVICAGVVISGGKFSLRDQGNSALPIGTVITAIDNTAATPISGTFSNLADGGIIVVGSNTFQANYEGGDGNNLTLTVVSGSR